MTLQLLQVPGGPELLVIFFIGLFVVGASLAATYWVYRDATSRGNDSAAIWAVVTLLGFVVLGPFGVVVLGIYLVAGRE